MKRSIRKGLRSVATQLKSKAGQNTAEYLLMLSIIGVGSIGLLTVFGGQIRNQFSGITAAIGGNTTKYGEAKENAAKIAEQAVARAKKKVAVGQVDKEELEFGDQK